ncbi:phosphatase domain-containing putative toxin [Winogradskyella alexanderae]|uniref:Tyrosine-protein phosphatase n=1 Tax=Winogradskyella alexanderae TaxID=2877123 RepID=A0ABS7XV03_9FLAO|nr:tyrosine-protein phosphatase [Winogradskyella alexanderae]MCA0132742.1 tyrosine-protein phosphatase [Winogradskyella alexanderae]
MNKTLLITLTFLFVGLHIKVQTKPAEKVESDFFKNLYQINEWYYRSEQPSKKGFAELEEAGVKTIINLRRLKDDRRKARNTNLQLEHIPLKTKVITENDIIEVLKRIDDAKKPVLVHCWHGSDRTGIITAVYRIVFENWTKSQAIKEFRQPEFGYHENWYPNLLGLINNLNVERVKAALNL